MNKKVISTLFGIAALSCGIAPSTFADPVTDSGSTDFSVTVGSYLNVTLSDSEVHLPIVPSSTGTFGSTYFTASSSTNNAYGYKLNLAIKDTNTEQAVLTTNLTSNTINVNDGSTPVIPTFTTNDELTSAQFSASTSTDHLNHWAMSIDDTDHYKKVTSESTIATSDGPIADDVTTLNLATKLDLLTPPGSYSAYFNFQIVANPVPEEPGTSIERAMKANNKTKKNVTTDTDGDGNDEEVTLYSMQDMTTAICNAADTPTSSSVSDIEETILFDERDDHAYRVAKLYDGRCWLLDNLALDLTDSTVQANMDNTNTNASSTALGYLFGVTSRVPSTDALGNYATAAVAIGESVYSNSAPFISKINKDVIPTSSDPLASQAQSGKWKTGILYNYCAVSAGTYCFGNGTGYGKPAENGGNPSGTAIDATEDICPTGWRLPTGYTVDSTERPDGGEYLSLNNAYLGIYSLVREALRFPLSGYVKYESSSAERYHGQKGWLWTATYGGTSSMYIAYADTSKINLSSGSYAGAYSGTDTAQGRYFNLAVRCIAK